MAAKDASAVAGLVRRLGEEIKARLPEGGRLLWLDPPGDANLAALGANGFSTRADHARRLGCKFGAWLETDKPYDAILVSMPKGRTAGQMLLRMAAEALVPGGALMLVGETRLGVKSAMADMQQLAGAEAEKLGHGNHCAAYVVRLAQPVEPRGLAVWWQSWAISTGIEVASLPGVFSSEALDDGTAFLLAGLEQSFFTRRKKVLDFGCGTGVIAAWAAKAGASVDAVDVSAWAVASTAETARRNGLAINAIAGSGLPGGGKYDVILSNPPFHDGRSVDLAVAREFLTQAKAHLRPNGVVRLVANRFLPYAEPLAEIFGAVETVADDGRFRVLQAGLTSRAKHHTPSQGDFDD